MKRMRMLGWCVAGAVCLAGVNQASAALSTGLTAYYTFNNTLNDGSPNLNHANWHESGAAAPDGVASYAAGKFGSGALLDGGTEHIQPGSADTPFDYGAAGFTISTWAKVNAFDTTWQALIVKGEGGNLRLHRNGGTNGLAFVAGLGDLANPANVNDGLFHHIVAVHDPSNALGGGAGNRLYVDGVSVFLGGATIVGTNNNPLMIGENPEGGSNREWNGVIDDLALWGRPLTNSEVLQLYNNGTGASLASLIAVPEPTTALLAILGLAGIGMRRGRREV